VEKNERTNAIERRVADMIGRLIEYWGFRAIMGRLWTFLYLSPEPLTAPELARRLGVSTGSISMAVTDLQKWGVVKKTWRPGDRKDFYEAETSIWKMVSRVIRERELVYVHDAIAEFDAARAQAAAERAGASAADKSRLKFIEGRLDTLLALSRVGESLLNLIIAGKSVDLSPLRHLFSDGREGGR
jgi:DNA-binding transcriptional regulator GbsR (MarR family)